MTPSAPSVSTTSRRWLILLLLLTAVLAWFGNLEYRKLVHPDEGRYAEISREMVASGDWLTPHLNGLKYFEKPALQYWATATAFKLFGEHHWTARLWSALTGFLGILLIYFTGRKLFGPEAGLYAALVLGSSLLYVLIGHLNTLDMGVTFFMTLGMCGLLLAQRNGATARETRNWMWVAAAAMGLAVLSKGLIGLVLPGAVLVIYMLVQRDFSLLRRLHLISGLLIFLAVCAPWFIAVSLTNPEFFNFFFIHEHFERFLTKGHGRYQPWYYFVPILLLGVLPWLGVIFDALIRAWKQGEVAARFHPQRFLLIWAVFIYFFFSISGSKLPSYILPILPALSLLAGQRLAQMKSAALFWHILPNVLLAIIYLVFATQMEGLLGNERVPAKLYADYSQWVIAAALVWLVAALLALYQNYRGTKQSAIIALALGGLIASQLTLTGHETLSREKTGYYLAQEISPHLKADAPFYSVGLYEQTLPFYLKRTVTLVIYQDEMAFGIRQEPEKFLPDLASFTRVWREQPQAFAIMSPQTYTQLQAEGLPMKKIAGNIEHTVVMKP